MKKVSVIKKIILFIFLALFNLSFGQWVNALPSNIDGTFDSNSTNDLSNFGWTSTQSNVLYSFPNPFGTNNPYLLPINPLENSSQDNKFIMLQYIPQVVTKLVSNTIPLEIGLQYRISFSFNNPSNYGNNGIDQNKLPGKWKIYLQDLESSSDEMIFLSESLCIENIAIWNNYTFEFEATSNYVKLIFVPQMGHGACDTPDDDDIYHIALDNIKLEYLPVTQSCLDCTSFEPVKGEKYLVSGWVKLMEESTTGNGISYSSLQTFKYENTFLGVSYIDSNQNLIGGSEIKFYPSGEIIDGWQKMEGTITIPSAIDHFKISLVNDNSNYAAFFDDVRVHPYNGNLKSFVYDQASQKLMAELDENNYATFYEYDKEGGLIRVKKETERGVYTIQETRSSTKKTDINGN